MWAAKFGAVPITVIGVEYVIVLGARCVYCVLLVSGLR